MNDVLLGYINRINEKIELLKKRNLEIKQEGTILAFRGEAKDYGKTKLMPSIYRNGDYIRKEKYLFNLLEDYDVITAEKVRNIEKAIEAQHYVSISRMLDITFSVLPALFFACESESNRDEAGYVYIFEFPEYYSPHSRYIEEFYSKMLDGENNSYSKNFKVFTHGLYNARIRAQQGGFIFFQGDEFAPISEVYYEVVKIKSEDKENIIKSLNELFAINRYTIYPELENRAKLAKEKFDAFIYEERRLGVDDELEAYFARITYECKMWKVKKSNSGEQQFYRFLRKEKADLLSYLTDTVTLETDEDRKLHQKRIKKTNDFFDMLEIL